MTPEVYEPARIEGEPTRQSPLAPPRIRHTRGRRFPLPRPQHMGAAMAWRRGQSYIYSEDLRGRVLAAVDGGMAARAAARVFRVSVSYIYKALIRRRRTGEVSASSRRGHRPRKLTPA